MIETDAPMPWFRPLQKSWFGFVFIHGHILAALIEVMIGAGLLAFLFHWVETNGRIQGETRRRKAELIPKVLHDGHASISVLASFRSNGLMLKQVPKDNNGDKEVKRSREERLRLYDEVYKLYVQQPKIEGINKEIQMVFSTNEVKRKSQDLEDLVVKKLWVCDDPNTIMQIVHNEAEPMLNALVELMQAELNQR